MKKTKIICTIGPASNTPEMMEQLALAGMNVIRLNMAHGTYEDHAEKAEMARQVSKKLNTPIAVLVDAKGPEIRTHKMTDGKVSLKSGQKLILSTEEVLGTEEKISISYKGLVNDVKPGNKILMDDGYIITEVEEVTDTEIIVRVKNDADLTDRKSVNVPGVHLSMEYMTAKNKLELEFAAKIKADFVACSFVTEADNVIKSREVLASYGASDIKLISKIESVDGVENFEEILAVSDGIMIARGDMGVELPMQQLPAIQKMMIRRCNEAGKPVITATQMLESMKSNPRPTRAEVTDVANAIYDGTSAIMLSAESASGKYPIEAVSIMRDIALETEQLLDYNENHVDVDNMDSVTETISSGAAYMAEVLCASAIVALTQNGKTANKLSKFRNRCHLIVVTDNEKIYNQMSLTWGAIPVLADAKETTDERIEEGIEKAKKTGLVVKDDKIVIVGGIAKNSKGKTNMINIHVME